MPCNRKPVPRVSPPALRTSSGFQQRAAACIPDVRPGLYPSTGAMHVSVSRRAVGEQSERSCRNTPAHKTTIEIQPSQTPAILIYAAVVGGRCIIGMQMVISVEEGTVRLGLVSPWARYAAVSAFVVCTLGFRCHMERCVSFEKPG